MGPVRKASMSTGRQPTWLNHCNVVNTVMYFSRKSVCNDDNSAMALIFTENNYKIILLRIIIKKDSLMNSC